jgi:hypothetical protein
MPIRGSHAYYFHGRVYLLLHFPQFLLVRPEGVVIIYGERKEGGGGIGGGEHKQSFSLINTRGANKFFRPINNNMSRVLIFMIANALLLNIIICMEVEIFKGRVKSVM